MILQRIFNWVASERGIEVTRGVAYGAHRRQRLDIYEASTTKAKRVIAMFFYGGGWREGSRDTYRFVGTALAARGITTIIPDYRLFPDAEFPDFMEDAALAYHWVDRELNNKERDARPIILLGHSAGAYIATLLALDRSYLERFAQGAQPPSAVIGLAGPYAFDPTSWPTTKDIFRCAEGDPDSARPVAFARAGAPPALLLHGAADETVGLFNGREFAGALARTGNEARQVEYPGIGHAGLILALAWPFRWRAPVIDDVLAFIAKLDDS